MPTNFPGGLTSQGVPVVGNGVPLTNGNVYFVDYDNGSDGNNGKSWGKAFKTIAKAYSTVTSNNNDVIVLSANSTHALTAMLTVAKNRVHFVGAGPLRHYGQRAKVSLGVTTAATDIATMTVTGVGCSFTNIKFINSNTVSEGIYCVAEGGEYTVYNNCEIYKDTDLNVTGAAEMLHNGDSTQMYNCTIGSLANAIVGAILRPCVLFTATLSGKKCRDAYFENCMFWRKAGDTANVFVYGANATDVERMAFFNKCTFMSNILGSATPAAAVSFGAAQTQGTVFLKDCSVVDVTAVATNDLNVYHDGAAVSEGASGIAAAIVT